MSDQPTSASSPEWEDLILPWSDGDTAASDRSSSTNTAPVSSSDGGLKSPDGKTSTTSPLLPTPKSQEGGWKAELHHRPGHRAYQEMSNGRIINRTWGVEQVVEVLGAGRTPAVGQGLDPPPTSSSGDTPVSPSAPLDDEEGPTILAISGLSSPVSLASFDRDACCWRTFQATLDLEQPKFSQTLPRSGMTRHGQLFELRMSVRPIAANDGSASLPTPDATHGRRTTRTSDLLPGIVETLLHSPTASDSDGKPRYDHRASPGYVRNKPVPNLAAQVIDELLPTPKTPTGGPESRDARTARGSRRGADLEGVVRDEVLLPTPEAWLGRSDGDRGRQSTTLPEALASIGEPTEEPSDDGSE